MASSLGGYEKGQSKTMPTYLGQSAAANPLLEHARAGAVDRARAQATSNLLFGGKYYQGPYPNTGPWTPPPDEPPPGPTPPPIPPGPGIRKRSTAPGPGTPFGYFQA